MTLGRALEGKVKILFKGSKFTGEIQDSVKYISICDKSVRLCLQKSIQSELKKNRFS